MGSIIIWVVVALSILLGAQLAGGGHDGGATPFCSEKSRFWGIQRLRRRKTALFFNRFIAPKLQPTSVADIMRMLNPALPSSSAASSSTHTPASICCPAHTQFAASQSCDEAVEPRHKMCTLLISHNGAFLCQRPSHHLLHMSKNLQFIKLIIIIEMA